MSDAPAQPTTGDAASESVVVDRARGLGDNPLYIVLAVAVALLVLFLAWTFAVSPLLLGDDAERDDVDLVAQPTPQATPVSPQATPDPGIEEDDLDEPPIGTVEVFLARDPFQPVRPEPAPAATDPNGTAPAPDPNADPTAPSPTDPTDPTAPTDPTDPSDPTAPRPGDPNDVDDGDPPSNDDRTTVEGRRYELVDVRLENGRPRAVLNIDGSGYAVSEGDTFLSAPQVAIREIDVDAQCVVFLHGDQRQRLCEGEAVLK